MHSCVYFVLVLGPLVQVMRPQHRSEKPVLSIASQSSPVNQWRWFRMKLELRESKALLQVAVTPKLRMNYKTTSHKADDEYHDRIQPPANVVNTFYGTTAEVCHINGLALGSQRISGIIMDASRTLLNATRLTSRVHNMDHVFVKLALTFFIHLLLRRNVSLELHLLSTAFFYWKTSSAMLTPTPSYSLQSTPHRVAPSPSSSFQSTISSDNQLFSRTFNATILSSKTHTTPNTAYIQIDKPATKTTDLKRLQGTCEEHWIQHGDLCYRVVLETRIFNYAERFCVINSAHLTSITSQEENDRIFELINKYIGRSGRQRVWLGMERLQSDSRLHWVDGQSLTYQNWAPGEPDSTGACVQMIRKGWWEDTSCSEKLPYICKKEHNIGLPYSRATELGILIGIPLACSAIMLSVVAFLLVKSVQDSDGTYFAFGKHRNKDKIHSCLVNMTASMAHVGGLGYVNDRRYTVSSMKSMSSTRSADNSRNHSRVNSIVDPPEIKITPETPEQGRKNDARVFASSSTSIEQERFQSTTSLDNLLSKKRIKPKSRRMRSLRKADAVVSPGGTMGRYKRKTKQFGDSEA